VQADQLQLMSEGNSAVIHRGQKNAFVRIAKILLSAICPFLGACLYTTTKPITYLATVVRVEQPEGEYYSPRVIGPSRSLTRIYLRPNDTKDSGNGTLLKVVVLGSYEPALLGEPGDVVQLTHAGPIQFSGEIPFEDLLRYRVVSKANSMAR
jgi:hypothetical protein